MAGQSGRANTIIILVENGKKGEGCVPQGDAGTRATLLPSDDVWAVLDDTYITCQVERIVPT